MGFWDEAKKTAGAAVNPVRNLIKGDVRGAFSSSAPASLGSRVMSGIVGKNNNSVLGKLSRGDLGGAFDATKSHAKEEADKKAKEMEQREEEQYGRNQEYNKTLGAQDDAYLGTMSGNVNKYQGDLDRLRGEIEDSQRDSKATYTNEIQPRLKGLMEQAQKSSAGAMTLQEAMDPNNNISQQTRNLYAGQGLEQRGRYDAEAERAQGGFNQLAQDTNDSYGRLATGAQGEYGLEGQRAQDAYNREAANTRTTFDEYGNKLQGQYQQQAQGEGKQGLADVGVLSALGMQNMAGQLGNVPMTGGQLQALMGANQAQSGQAYAQTQRRVQSLKDQGLKGNIDAQHEGLGRATDMRGKGVSTNADMRSQGLGRATDLRSQGLGASTELKGQGVGRASDIRGTGLQRQADLEDRGIERGFERSDSAYGKGLQAQDRYRNSVGDYESGADRQAARDTDYRGQRGNISNSTYGLQQQMNDATRGVANSKTTRDMANYNTHMGGKQANSAAQIAGINAGEAQKGQMISGGMQAAGTAAGAYFGGPGGAKLGQEAGKAAGDANQPQQASVPQYGNYNGGRSQAMPEAYAPGGGGGGQNMPMPPDEQAGTYGLQGGFQQNPYAYQNRPVRMKGGR